jgi:hypothetical protein
VLPLAGQALTTAVVAVAQVNQRQALAGQAAVATAQFRGQHKLPQQAVQTQAAVVVADITPSLMVLRVLAVQV